MGQSLPFTVSKPRISLLRRRRRLLASLALGLGILGFGPDAHAQKKGIFFPSIQTPIERGAVGNSFTFSLGFFFSGISPLKNPYAQVEGSNAIPFRYQMPSSFGVEASFAIFRWLEVGASAEYGRFSSRFVSAGANVTRSDSVTYTALPVVKGIARGIFNVSDGFAFVTEVAGGFGRGTARVSSTDQNANAIENTISSFVGHAGAGIAMMWEEGYSVHTLVGFGLHTMGDNRYTANQGIYDVIQDGNFAGPFGKVLLRYQF